MSKNNYLNEGESEIFWLDNFNGEAQGGLYWRGFDLINFLERCKKQGIKIVGIKIDDSYNIEFIRKKEEMENENKSTN